jgi:hypothetical protein
MVHAIAVVHNVETFRASDIFMRPGHFASPPCSHHRSPSGVPPSPCDCSLSAGMSRSYLRCRVDNPQCSAHRR